VRTGDRRITFGGSNRPEFYVIEFGKPMLIFSATRLVLVALDPSQIQLSQRS
jgi:hypothetical protein